MSEPTRLRDDGPDEVRALLRAGRPARPITAEQRARTAKRLARYASAAAVAATLSWVPGAALGAGLGVATVIVAWGVPALLAPSPRPAPPPPATAVVTKPAPSAEPEVPPPSPSASAVAPPKATVAAPTASAGGDALAEEAALLEQARAALGASPAEALALAEAHAARFPSGKLGMEREMVAIDALRRLGRTPEARARAEAMLARAQGSLYEPRVKKLLEGM
jgi:hypothetical protein